ncbi:hypothetical protein C8R44DRAFT_613155, partial [Mycena epipterygia]
LESPFAHHLHTNYVPSDSEFKQINAHLASCFPEVLRLDSLTSHCQRMTHIKAHKVLVSPVRQLPRDIVQEISLTCFPTHRNAVMSAKEAPLILTRGEQLPRASR